MPRRIMNGIDLVSSGKVQNALDPSNPQDYVTLNYLQAFLRGMTNKNAVRAASTANVSLSAPGASIDGVTLNNGDRVLLKNQTTASQNGIYVWSGASSALVAASDFTGSNIAEGDTTFAAEGTVNQSTSWTLQSNLTTWVQTGGVAVSYTAGNGLQLSSSQFAVKLPAASGLIADVSGLYIDGSVVVKKYAQNFGDGTTTTFTITHSLAGGRDVQAVVYDNTTFAEEWPDVVHATATTVTLTYASAPASASKRVVLFG